MFPMLIVLNILMGIGNFLISNGFDFAFYVGVFNFCGGAFILGVWVANR